MRVYLPATFNTLQELSDTGGFTVRSGYGFAVTPALNDYFVSGDPEEVAHFAFIDAARASLRLLAIGDNEAFPHRRVVISADIDDNLVELQPHNGESVVKLSPAHVELDAVAAIHVDIESSEAATAAAIEAIDAADLGDEDAEFTVGDADDNFMAWYDPIELAVLVELM
ncbi:DUF6912 family protein [Corynebacterium durum]